MLCELQGLFDRPQEGSFCYLRDIHIDMDRDVDIDTDLDVVVLGC